MKKHLRFDDLSKKLVKLLDVEGEQISIIDFILEKVINDVANYVHIPIVELPEELDSTIISLCIQNADTHQFLTPKDEKSGNVSSLSEGDTSVTFKSKSEVYAELQSVNTLTDNYIAQLNSFRKIKR